MGVNVYHIVMMAVDVGYDNVSYDDIEPYLFPWQDDGAPFDVIYDSMSGEYAYAGKILLSSENHEAFGRVHKINELMDNPHMSSAMTRVIERFPHVEMKDFEVVVLTYHI